MKTLRSKFLVFILLPVIIVFTALSIFSYITARDLLLSQIRISGQNYLQIAAEKINESLVDIESVLNLIAIKEEVIALDDSTRLRLFRRIQKYLGKTVTSVFMDFSDGTMIRSKSTPLPSSART